MIVQAVETFETNLETEKPLLASIEVDRILAEAVAEVLKCQTLHFQKQREVLTP